MSCISSIMRKVNSDHRFFPHSSDLNRINSWFQYNRPLYKPWSCEIHAMSISLPLCWMIQRATAFTRCESSFFHTLGQTKKYLHYNKHQSDVISPPDTSLFCFVVFFFSLHQLSSTSPSTRNDR